jgi:hypothetical protein
MQSRASGASKHRMRTLRSALLCLLLACSGCRKPYVVPEAPMPANTILLSEMMRQLSAQPGFIEGLLKQLEGNGNKKGPALMTPVLVNDLRDAILGRNWQHLDRFPGWTMREINPTVRVIGHEAGKSSKLEADSEVHPGASPADAQAGKFIDLGPYALDRAEAVSLDTPSTLRGFTTDGIVTPVGDGVVRGDGPNALASEHAESQRLADVLNRLAINKLDGAQTFTATVAGNNATTPEALMQALAQAGANVIVQDARYFANFGHFHYQPAGAMQAEDVMMPFYANSEIKVPGTRNRPLLVPVSHAELEWHIRPAAEARGPKLNADVAYYFGIDGKAEWRTMDTLDQSWVLKRNAHTYAGADAIEVTRLTGLMTAAYMRLHAAHPKLPFGGYYALGVCQDGVSAVEQKMTGHVTLFPNTADDSFFNDSRDAEVNAMIAAIPKDRSGRKPEPERIFGSLPTEPDAQGRFDAITIPGLASDLNLTYAAWKDGKLERTYTRWELMKALLFVGSAIGLALYLAVRTRRFLDANTPGQHRPLR